MASWDCWPDIRRKTKQNKLIFNISSTGEWRGGGRGGGELVGGGEKSTFHDVRASLGRGGNRDTFSQHIVNVFQLYHFSYTYL